MPNDLNNKSYNIGINQEQLYQQQLLLTISSLRTELSALSGSSGSVWGSITGTLSNQTDLQTALNAKEDTITTLSIAKGGTNSGTALSNNRVIKSSGGAIVEAAAITASRALKSDANGIPVHFDTATEPTLTELSYVKGVTSAIQTQLNAKTDSIILSNGGSNTTVAAGATEFAALFGGSIGDSTTESVRQSIIPVAGTISRFYVKTTTAQPATGSFVLTIRVNGVDTAVSITIAAGSAAGTFSDIIDTAAVAAGDLISIGLTNNSATASAQIITVSAILTR